MKQSGIILLSLLILASTSCPSAPNPHRSPMPESYFPLQPGKFWKYSCFAIDGRGRKIVQTNGEESDSVIKAQNWLGRYVAMLYKDIVNKQKFCAYSFSNEGDLQMFVDTTRRMSLDLYNDPSGLDGYWENVENFGDETVGHTSVMQEMRSVSIGCHGAHSRGNFLGTRTHFRTYMGDTTVDVPAGKFTVQVRVDSVVDSLFHKFVNGIDWSMEVQMSQSVLLTTVSRKYYAPNVGLVLERSTFVIGEPAAHYLKSAGEGLWAEWEEGVHTKELVSYK